MAAKRFSLVMIAGAFLLFAATVTANVLFDPELVFGTDIFTRTVNWNERVGRLAQYKREAPVVDGLLFSSSRGNVFDKTVLARGMGVSNLMNQSVSYGMITDYLPIFEYILRDKAARDQPIKAVMLLIDPDLFGKPPWTNSNINSFLPPELSGESPARYWWRYLTVFQFRLWRDVLRSGYLKPADAAVRTANEMIPAASSQIPVVSEDYRRSWNSVRPDFERQMADLTRFVALCREHRVALTIAISPLIDPNLRLHEPGMIDALILRLSQVAPVWDFNSPPLIAGRGEYWLDFSHFSPSAAAMMMNRMFGVENPPPFAEFGRLRSPEVKN